MERKVARFINKGMSKDLAISKINNEFAFDNQNIRITPDKESTLLSVSNEKGTYKVPDITINGTVIGYCLCNDKILLFSTFRKLEGDAPEFPDDGKEYSADYLTLVYNKAEKSGYRLVGEVLYEGDLGLSMDRPVETLFNYETETVQKVYWIDGVHQVRYVNIVADSAEKIKWGLKKDPFSLLQELELNETIAVRRANIEGQFPSGTIQYFITYSNYFGRETPVIWQSDVINLTTDDRGLSPEEYQSTSFIITVANFDEFFDRINLYSIIRTTLDGTPQGRVIRRDLKTEFSLMPIMTILDTGMVYESIDASEILYKGGDLIYPSTMTSKDNTLFLGNNVIESYTLDDSLIESIKTNVKLLSDSRKITADYSSSPNYKYIYQDYATDSLNRIFKAGNTYNIGIQFQNKYGQWSNVVEVGTWQTSNYPTINNYGDEYTVYTPSLYVTDSLATALLNAGYRKMRAVRLQNSSREIIAQGLVCPTVFKVGSRDDNTAYCQASWFARPFSSKELWDENISDIFEVGQFAEFRHNAVIPEYGEPFLLGNKRYSEFNNVLKAEIQCNYGSEYTIGPYIKNGTTTERQEFVTEHKNSFFVDTNIIGFYSPDIDENISLGENVKFRIVGYTEIVSNVGAKFLNITNPAGVSSGMNMYQVQSGFSSRDGDHGGNSLISGPFYYSFPYKHDGNDNELVDTKKLGYIIFPWHKTGTVNIDSTASTDILQSNITSNLHYGGPTIYRKNMWTPPQGIDGPVLFKETEDIAVILQNSDDSTNLYYKGNINEVLYPRTIEFNDIVTLPAYPILAANIYGGSPNINTISPVQCHVKSNDVQGATWNDSIWNNSLDFGTTGVSMKYKSTPHAILRFKDTATGSTVILPGLNTIPLFQGPYGNREFWNTEKEDFTETSINLKFMGILDILLTGWVQIAYMQEYKLSDPDFSIVGIEKKEYPSNFNPAIGDYIVLTSVGDDSYSIGAMGWKSTEPFLYGDIGSASPLQPNEVLKQFNQTVLRLVAEDLETRSGIVDVWKAVTIDELQGVNPDMVFAYENTTYKFYSTEDFYLYINNIDSMDNYPAAKMSKFNWVSSSVIAPTTFYTYLLSETSDSYMFIGELYRDTEATVDTNQNWIPCSKAFNIGEKVTNTYGDTWLQRYDILRTYAYDSESENSVIDIVSTVLESYVNTNGRYDRNRGSQNNTFMSPLNFNLFNSVYNQSDNFITGTILNSRLFNTEKFKTSIIWSLPKNPGAEIDNWTHLYSSSVLYLDGDKGELRSLNRLGNSIISFQDKGIAEIMFNSYAQLQATQGLPIELANSGKVDGKRYLYNNAGCINKWSIVERDNSLYFIDDISGSINVMNPQLISLSDTKGFKTWINNNSTLDVWTPYKYANVRGFYDKSLNDIYWSSKDYCLVYSELLQQFMSFMPYRSTSMIENFNGHLITERNGSLWYMQEGEYNNFYGNYEDYSMQYRITPDPYGDKIFTNIEYRSDMFEGDTEVPFDTFDTLTAETEYQHGQIRIVSNTLQPSSAKKKFRIWRVNIPRDAKNKDSNPYGLNRIRNPWVNLTLTKKVLSGDEGRRNIFHDLTVYYYE